MSAATDAETPAAADPRTTSTGVASILSDALAQFHAQGVGLSIRRAIWLSRESPHVEMLGECLLVEAPDADAARRLLARSAVQADDAAPTPTAPPDKWRRRPGGDPIDADGLRRATTPESAWQPMETAATVDLREAKREAAQWLPPGHPVREGLLAEADLLPLAEGRAKIGTYLRFLFLKRGPP